MNSSTLSEMWYRHNLFSSFKDNMNSKGWIDKDLYILDVQLNLLKQLIEIESINIFKNMLIHKTYYRLLKSIDKGIEYLPDLIENPEQYVLNPIEKDSDAWNSDEVLIFCTKKNEHAVFSKIIRKDEGFKYVDNKWQ